MAMEEPDGATPLDPDEREGLRYGHVTTRGQLNELEQANIQSGLLWLSGGRLGDVLTDAFAIRLHRRLFGDVWTWAGTFRRTEKNIGIDPLRIGVELRNLMDDARFWADHGTYDAVEMAVRLHHRMVQIHPFPNGNGRHARIMADTVLRRIHRHAPLNWGAGHSLDHMSDRRRAYIAALRAADRGDPRELIALVRPA